MHIDPSLLQRCWFLAGPTASGKTAVSLELARQLRAEIVALDSMTLYRGMDIGTAKPTVDERATVPHHLFDVLDPHEDFSVAEYLAAAERCIREIMSHGNTPLFVGGAGLYLRSLLRGVFDGPAADLTLRSQFDAEAERLGPAALHARLAQVDPPTAARLHPHDTRRVVRALEVQQLTGRPLSTQQTESPVAAEYRPQHVYWLDPPRDWLHERINQRVMQMLSLGLVDEVKRLRSSPLGLGRTAQQALGYKEVLAWLDQGDKSLATLIATLQNRTRQFAKRQVTWFRNMPECRAVAVLRGDSAADVANRVMSGLPTAPGLDSLRPNP